MKRRRSAVAPSTAEEVARVGAEVHALAGQIYDPADPLRQQFVRARLAEHGLDPLLVIAARYWLRRGKRPRDYYHAVENGWR